MLQNHQDRGLGIPHFKTHLLIHQSLATIYNAEIMSVLYYSPLDWVTAAPASQGAQHHPGTTPLASRPPRTHPLPPSMAQWPQCTPTTKCIAIAWPGYHNSTSTGKVRCSLWRPSPPSSCTPSWLGKNTHQVTSSYTPVLHYCCVSVVELPPQQCFHFHQKDSSCWIRQLNFQKTILAWAINDGLVNSTGPQTMDGYGPWESANPETAFLSWPLSYTQFGWKFQGVLFPILAVSCTVHALDYSQTLKNKDRKTGKPNRVWPQMR